MAVDITQLFLDLIHSSDKESIDVSKRQIKISNENEFSFQKRAQSLWQNLRTLSKYLNRIHELSINAIGNNVIKQHVYAELTEQSTILFEQCTALLSQLFELIPTDSSYHNRDVDTVNGVLDKQKQLYSHRLAVYKYLTDELNNLKTVRNEESNRQKHLLELTGSLASGVKSVKASGLKVTNYFDQPKNSECHVTKRTKITDVDSLGSRSVDVGAKLSDTELKTLEVENRKLYSQLVQERDEVHEVARAITEIGRLNQALSNHLMEQLETTEHIADTSVSATEYIRQGNELLRDAINRKATVQFWILFILIVLTFSLHFLDWYYP